MSDPHLVYNKYTKLLEIWYRQALTSLKTEVIYRRTSIDGHNWNEREEEYRHTGTEDGYAIFYIFCHLILYMKIINIKFGQEVVIQKDI